MAEFRMHPAKIGFCDHFVELKESRKNCIILVNYLTNANEENLTFSIVHYRWSCRAEYNHTNFCHTITAKQKQRINSPPLATRHFTLVDATFASRYFHFHSLCATTNNIKMPCAICLDFLIDGQNLKSNHCGHVFHENCIGEYVRQ